MSSILKNQRSLKTDSKDVYLDSFVKKLSGLKTHSELELLAKKIRYLGLNFDPFEKEHGLECEAIIDQLDLRSQLNNPYQVTNIILRLLDLTEEKINNLKQ